MLVGARAARRCCNLQLSLLRSARAGQNRSLTSPAPLSTIEHLQAAFRDKSSPFYLEPGTQGPSSPGEGFIVPEQVYTLNTSREVHTATDGNSVAESQESSLSPDEEGREKLSEQGFDPESFYEQKVVWGDMDSFRHVNNVRYSYILLRTIDSYFDGQARIHWMLSLGREMNGEQGARNMIVGKGISLILGEVSIKFRRPVLYPDTLLIAHRPHNPYPTHFNCAAAIWSYSQRAVVATSDSKLVWYDYDRLKKCDPGPEAHAILARRI